MIDRVYPKLPKRDALKNPARKKKYNESEKNDRGLAASRSLIPGITWILTLSGLGSTSDRFAGEKKVYVALYLQMNNQFRVSRKAQASRRKCWYLMTNLKMGITEDFA